MGNWVKLAFLSLRKNPKNVFFKFKKILYVPCVDDVILMMAMIVGAVFNYAKDDDDEEENEDDYSENEYDGDRDEDNDC